MKVKILKFRKRREKISKSLFWQKGSKVFVSY